jgi:hypothetical protein
MEPAQTAAVTVNEPSRNRRPARATRAADGKHPTPMKVMTRYRNIDPDQQLDAVIEAAIRELEKRIKVEAAEITVERSRFETPPVRTSILIVTPGPDLQVEARDYTTPAAFIKAHRELLRRAGLKQQRTLPTAGPAPRPARALRGAVRSRQPRH